MNLHISMELRVHCLELTTLRIFVELSSGFESSADKL